MSPFYYYAAGVIRINWYVVAMSSLADVLPAQWRATSFGILSAGYSVGQALSPRLALWVGYLMVSLWSLLTLLLGLCLVVLFIPETLHEETRRQARLQRTERQMPCWYRPLWELTILNRTSLFRMLSSLAFFSGMVSSADYTILVYYLQEQLSFNDKDIANLYVLMGVLGIFVQSAGLKALLETVGERRTISISFAFGAVHSLLYGLAKEKVTIFVAMALGVGVTMAFPTISALQANNVTDSEQGRIQGALYSVQAIASGLGPAAMRQIYGWSQDGTSILWGPGTMFLFAFFFYIIAVFYAWHLKVRRQDMLEGICHYSLKRLPFQEEADTIGQDYEETNQLPDDDAVN
jgi:DHA1 family tetracycline resistance protein-like MFS transporter